MELRVHTREPGEITAEFGPLFMRVMNGAETTPESVDRLTTQLEDMLERWPVVAVLVVVEHGTPQPAPELRRRVDEDLRRFGERIVLGYAFLGLGFWRVDAREFGTGRASRLRAPVLVTGTVHELASKVALELIGVSPELIEATLERLRAEVSP